MRRTLLVAVTVAGWAAPMAVTAQTDQVSVYARTFLARRRIPSAAIAVVKDGKIVLSAAYGTANLELNVPATETTVYEIGSISKQFTATAILSLADEGKLGLADPITKYLPDLPPTWSGMTIRHLVTHTSGLPDWESRTSFSYRSDYTPAEFLKLVSALPLDFAPGARFAYTNTGAPILGMIIERVSGTDYERFVTERLFRSAGMSDIRFKHPGEIVPNRAGGYVDEDSALRNGEPCARG